MSTLLLIIDPQRGFCEPGGSIAAQGRSVGSMVEAAVACGRLADEARRRGVPVVWTRMSFRPDYADGGRLISHIRPNIRATGSMRAGTEDVAFVEAAGYRAGETVIEKNRFSALLGTELEALLRTRGVTRVIVAGVTTSMCVETTARDLSQRDYEVIVVEDAVGDFDAARHEASLAALAFGFATVAAFDAAVSAMDEPRMALAG